MITTLAGSVFGFKGDGGPATEARLWAPMSVAVDSDGNVYIADLYNYRIRKVDVDGVISTIAGTGERGSTGDGGPATEATLFECCPPNTGFPGGMAVDAHGNLYVADGTRVRKIDPSGVITSVPGVAAGGPLDVAVDDAGSLYVSHADGRAIDRIAPDGEVTRVAGGAVDFNTRDGVAATSAFLLIPWGIAVDADGNVYIAEHRANRIRKVDLDGIITTVAGMYEPSSGGQGKFNGEEGPATQMSLNEPIGLFVDSAGVLYIADAFNARIRAVHFAR